jgi:hypothetical protein
VYTSISANSNGEVPDVNTREQVVELFIEYFAHSQESINLKLSLVEVRSVIISFPYSSIATFVGVSVVTIPRLTEFPSSGRENITSFVSNLFSLGSIFQSVG